MTTEAQTTEQTLAKILTLCKNNGTTLDELIKLPVLDAEGKIPAAVLRIVGALSTGAVIESGDNANGNYVRFADGTQVCWVPSIQSIESSGLARHVVWSFPAQFIDEDVCFSSAVADTLSELGLFMCAFSVDDTSLTAAYTTNRGTSVSGTLTVCCLAIGRWK